MKKITLLFATLLVTITSFAATLTGGTKLYLKPGVWNVDNAKFVAYYWGDANGDQWSDFNDSDNDGIFETTAPNGSWTGLKFVRMNPDGDIHNWDNKWNETNDLTYDGTNNMFTITDWNTGVWSTYNNEGGNNNPDKPTTNITNGTQLYLNPNNEWKSDGARFAAYLFGGDGELWISMSDSNGDGIYEVTCQGNHEKIIFCRMNPASTDNTWDNKWNQTDNLTYDGTNNQYNITGWDNSGNWSIFGGNNGGNGGNGGNDDPEKPQPEADVYTLCGDSIIFGTSWDETDTNNDMTKGEDGVWVKEYKDLTLSKGTYEYKVVASHNWETPGKYPSDDTNMTLYITKDGIYNIKFAFDPTIPELKVSFEYIVGVENITINNIYAINGYVHADTNITIYTITGQDVTSQNGNLSQGVYIIKTQNATSKLIIK